jgi:hypothetical protein
MTGQPTFPTLLEGFFTRRLMRQRQASAHTIASYRELRCGSVTSRSRPRRSIWMPILS